ncbi:hypothetical protein [Micromonospora sp. NPDC126480]|uniref:hypothetical protein n=1 Tax=Micromonospora sp. NPDC126480 TaxID=3155312 RepID=UPI00332A31D1
MRDELTFVERMRRDLGAVRWAEPADIRARARRRSRRTALLAGVAVLTTLSAAAVAVADRGYGSASEPAAASAPVRVPVTAASTPAPAPVTAATSSPAPARATATGRAARRVEVPHEALVQQSDLAARTGLGTGGSGLLQLGEPGLGERVDVGLGLDRCSAGPETTAWVSRSVTLLRRADGGDRRPADVLVTQDLYRLPGDEATRFFQQVRKRLADCREWREVRSAEYDGTALTVESTHRWETLRVDFAGDEAMLLRHSVSPLRDSATGEVFGGPTAPEQRVVLRVGDLVTVLSADTVGDAELVRIAETAARRMCVAANPPC